MTDLWWVLVIIVIDIVLRNFGTTDDGKGLLESFIGFANLWHGRVRVVSVRLWDSSCCLASSNAKYMRHHRLGSGSRRQI